MSFLFSLFYRYAAWLNRLFPNIERGGRQFVVLPSVYKPLEHEEHMVDRVNAGERLLDVGCGSGVFSVLAALKGVAVTAVDINPECVENTQRNAATHQANVRCFLSDTLGAVDGVFDVIFTASPYIELKVKGDGMQWATSTGFIEKLCAQASPRLAPGGRVLLIAPTYRKARVEKAAAANGLTLARIEPTPRWTDMLPLKFLYFQPPIPTRVFVLTRVNA